MDPVEILNRLYAVRSLSTNGVNDRGTNAEKTALAQLHRFLQSKGKDDFSWDMPVGQLIAWAFTN